LLAGGLGGAVPHLRLLCALGRARLALGRGLGKARGQDEGEGQDQPTHRIVSATNTWWVPWPGGGFNQKISSACRRFRVSHRHWRPKPVSKALLSAGAGSMTMGGFASSGVWAGLVQHA
jgi:hypothetical protein